MASSSSLPPVRDISPVGRPFLLSEAQLRRSLQLNASDAAMARVWAKLESGAPLRIGVLGSSVGMSGGCQAEHQPQLRCAQFDGLQVRKRARAAQTQRPAPSGQPPAAETGADAGPRESKRG